MFATYYQQLLVSIIPGVPSDRLDRWNNFILCVEMTFFALIQMRAYNWNEFSWNEPQSGFLESMGDAVSLRDVAADIRHSFRPAYDAYALAEGPSPARRDSDSGGGGRPGVAVAPLPSCCCVFMSSYCCLRWTSM